MNNNIREFIHDWANLRPTSYKNCGNISYNTKQELLSYSQVICKLDADVAILHTTKYSAATSKHQNYVKNATTQYFQLFAHVNLNKADTTNILYSAIQYLDSLINAKNIDTIAILEQSHALHHFIGYYPKELEEIKTFHNLPENFARLLTLVSRSYFYHIGDFLPGLLFKTFPELEEKYNKTLLREKTSKESLIKKRVKDLANWRLNKNNRSFFTLPPALRLSKDGLNVETSHGASVPLAEAKELFKLYQSNKILAGTKIGNYSVRSLDISNQVIIIGCHSIPLIEAINLFEVKN